MAAYAAYIRVPTREEKLVTWCKASINKTINSGLLMVSGEFPYKMTAEEIERAEKWKTEENFTPDEFDLAMAKFVESHEFELKVNFKRLDELVAEKQKNASISPA